MIKPPGRSGVAFTESSDGDQRSDEESRRVLSRKLGIPGSWATVDQVHGSTVIEVTENRPHAEGDALWTRRREVPLAVFTADCFGVVIHADNAVGVAHAGWRGAQAGLVSNLRATMTKAGHKPNRAEIGPGIGSCCFEVGPDVSELFPSDSSQTRWGTPSVDLERVLESQLEGLDLWANGGCTMHEDGWLSHRRDATPLRLASIGWLA